MRLPIVSAGCHNDSDSDHRAEHTERPNQEERLASDLINDHNGRHGDGDVYDTNDSSGEKRDGAACKAQRLKDGTCIIDDSTMRTLVWLMPNYTAQLTRYHSTVGRT